MDNGFVMQMYHSFEHICFEKKKALFSWPQTTIRTTLVSTKTGQELGAQDTVGGKSVLMQDTADGDAIHIHIKKHELSLLVSTRKCLYALMFKNALERKYNLLKYCSYAQFSGTLLEYSHFLLLHTSSPIHLFDIFSY